MAFKEVCDCEILISEIEMCEGKDWNAGHYEESQKYGVSATVCAVFYRNDFFTTDIWL
jgi:hypothetical protein